VSEWVVEWVVEWEFLYVSLDILFNEPSRVVEGRILFLVENHFLCVLKLLPHCFTRLLSEWTWWRVAHSAELEYRDFPRLNKSVGVVIVWVSKRLLVEGVSEWGSEAVSEWGSEAVSEWTGRDKKSTRRSQTRWVSE
jgi:hypothetical protein